MIKHQDAFSHHNSYVITYATASDGSEILLESKLTIGAVHHQKDEDKLCNDQFLVILYLILNERGDVQRKRDMNIRRSNKYEMDDRLLIDKLYECLQIEKTRFIASKSRFYEKRACK
uniref:Uncharacterized protein n=1 Tax=Romanomermis culicivorax TaxID=13658 RepID=A0A915I2R2_ROMCU